MLNITPPWLGCCANTFTHWIAPFLFCGIVPTPTEEAYIKPINYATFLLSNHLAFCYCKGQHWHIACVLLKVQKGRTWKWETFAGSLLSQVNPMTWRWLLYFCWNTLPQKRHPSPELDHLSAQSVSRFKGIAEAKCDISSMLKGVLERGQFSWQWTIKAGEQLLPSWQICIILYLSEMLTKENWAVSGLISHVITD